MTPAWGGGHHDTRTNAESQSLLGIRHRPAAGSTRGGHHFGGAYRKIAGRILREAGGW